MLFILGVFVVFMGMAGSTYGQNMTDEFDDGNGTNGTTNG